MTKAVDIQAALAGLKPLRGRNRHTAREVTGAAFAQLGALGNAKLFTGSFTGESDWERHRGGDELVQILDGATALTIIGPEGPVTHQLRKGMLIVVPQGSWHRFQAPDGVTVLTATPQPTDHTAADDPRTTD